MVPTFMYKRIVRCVLTFNFIVLILSRNFFCHICLSRNTKFRCFMIATKSTKIDIDRIKIKWQYIMDVLSICGWYRSTRHWQFINNVVTRSPHHVSNSQLQQWYTMIAYVQCICKFNYHIIPARSILLFAKDIRNSKKIKTNISFSWT